ncbi:hypothetical protein GCM10025865_24400 [Paraoerskovia sediminicola]|uniref:Nucleotidyl transferase AbiEii toxin, Type IV TA system n=1 Tax=Paraoerskovia sediminicola TaxID=1138587 RepID=A0ABN6XHM7_9CELL|nr:nucleotidyl transferase AbiEii/AbiGii toxin family protein [Paraoerskovia sediminicola]BDZ43141.1 hypothetical protein GCM10025865_24400 [Paraoerskovia sediminicola]
MDAAETTNLASALSALKPKVKAPNSARVLDGWILRAERQLGSDGGRLGWLVASTVVAAALQQAVDAQGRPMFLLKGGTLLQHRLPRLARTTTDLDGLVRGDLDQFIETLDGIFARPWGPCTLRRDRAETIDVPNRVLKPRRFDIVVRVNGITWRRIQVEVSPDEGSAGAEDEPLNSPSLAAFGLPTPDHLIGLAMRYQIAQKIHAVSDPHDPPAHKNDRARDVVDLLLLRDLARESDSPTDGEILGAVMDIFEVRARDAAALGLPQRHWPARLTAHAHWADSYRRSAESAGLGVVLSDAVESVNTWLAEISDAGAAPG